MPFGQKDTQPLENLNNAGIEYLINPINRKLDEDEITSIIGEYDAVIACTGYKIKHKFFDKNLINFENGPVNLLHRMLPANIKNLYFIGLFQPLGCIWPGAELQSKLAARHLAGEWAPKGDIKKLIESELNNPDVEQLKTDRHTITVDDYSFRNRLKKELARAK